MLKPVYLVAFSGHRPADSPGRTNADLIAAAPGIEKALAQLKAQVETNGGELQFISSLAAGSDIIACRAALRLGLPLHIFLSLPEEDFFEVGFVEKDHLPWKDPALQILAAVHPHTKLHPSPPPSSSGILPLTHANGALLDLAPSHRHTLRVLDSAGTTTERYALANAKMLEAADALLLVNVTGSKNSSAGTARLKTQADAILLPYICIDPLHDVSTSHHLEFLADPKAPSRVLMGKIDHHLSRNLASSADPFAKLVDCLRTQANNKSKKARFGMGSAISLHATAGFIAAFAAACSYYFKKESPHFLAYFALFAIVELVLVATAFTLEWLGHRRHERETWHLCRFAREVLRGIEASSPFLDPLFPEISRHRLEWDRFAVTAALLLRQKKGPLAPTDLLAARDAYVKDRVLNQHAKYKADSDKAKLPALLFKNVAHWSAQLALPVVAFAALVKTAELIDSKDPFIELEKHSIFTPLLLLFLPILLPLAASLGTSFISTFDFARRAARYPEMVRALEKTAHLLPTFDTFPTINDTIRRTEEILIDEIIDWHASQLSSSGG